MDRKPERAIQEKVRDFIQRNKEQKDCDLRTATANHEGKDRSESYNSEAKEIRAIKRIWGNNSSNYHFSLPFTVLKFSLIASF